MQIVRNWETLSQVAFFKNLTATFKAGYSFPLASYSEHMDVDPVIKPTAEGSSVDTSKWPLLLKVNTVP